MSVPRNISPAYATVIGSLPYETHQDASLAPVGTGYRSTCDVAQRNALWFVLHTRKTQTWLGIQAAPTDGAADYDPVLSIWTGTPPGTLTQYVIEDQKFCGNLGALYWQVPVQPDTSYYLQITNASAVTPLGTTLHLQIVDGPNEEAPAGSILIVNDFSGFPAAVLSGTDAAFLRFLSLPTGGECGDTMPTGELCVCTTGETGVVIYDANLAIVATHDFGTHVWGIKSDRSNLFYIVTSAAAGGEICTVHTISKAGVVGGATWALPADSMAARIYAVTRDGATFFYATPANGEPVHAYDLNGDAPLSDLSVGFTGEQPAGSGDGYVAVDGTILIAYKLGASGASGRIRRFNPNGTVHTLYTLSGMAAFTTFNRFAFVDETAFTGWAFNSGGAAFQTVRLSDSVRLSELTDIRTLNGDPYAISTSCPLIIVPPPGLPPPSSPPIADELIEWTSPICGSVRFQRIVLTGADFPDAPVVTATDSEGHTVVGTIASHTPTEIVLLIGLLSCTDWTFVITDAEGDASLTQTFLLQPATECECCMEGRLTLINDALYKIGVSKTLTSLADVSRESTTGQALVNDAIQETLRRFPWPFATRYADAADADSSGDPMELVGGTASAPVNGDWQYAYRQPSDCLFERRIVKPGQGRRFDPTPIPFRRGTFWAASEDDAYPVIFTNQVDAVLEYTANVECLAAIADAIFRDAAGWLLASKLAPSLSKLPKMAEQAIAMFERTFAIGGALAAREQQQDLPGDAEWITGR